MAIRKDNAYYLNRLRRDFPQVYADHLSGKHRTVRDARRAAGILSERTPLHELNNAWRKASAVERQAFRASIGSSSGPPAPSSGSHPPSAVDIHGHLTPGAVARIEQILSRRKIDLKAARAQMGLSPHNQALSMAIIRNWKINAPTAARLDAWLAANISV